MMPLHRIGLLMIALTISATPQLCEGSRILVVLPIPLREQQSVYQPLLDALAQRNHTLVVMTTDPIHEDHLHNTNNVQQIDLSFVYQLDALEKLQSPEASGTEMMLTVFEVIRSIADAELNAPAVQKLLMDDMEHFDAVLVDWSGASIMNAFAHHFGAPLMALSTGGALINAHQAFGNPNHPVAYSNILLPFSEDLSLLQRIASVLFGLEYRWMYFHDELPRQNEIARNHFGAQLPDLWSIEENADLLLINAYQMLGNVRPVGPTTVYLGGMHAGIKRYIPWELQNFLDAAEGDVAFINLGASTGELLAVPWRLEKFIAAVEELHVDVIWNTAAMQMMNITKRSFVSSHLPQEIILANPKVKLFITNGGQRNIEDAIHQAVPVFGISYSSNLDHYLRQIQKHDAGVISLIDFESEAEFTQKLGDILSSEKYSTNMQKLHDLVLDQPMTPIDRAVWWIEYTMRHHGTKHMECPLKHTPWWKYFLVDVFVVVDLGLKAIICACIYVIYRLVMYSRSLPVEMITRGGTKAKML